MTDRPSSHGSAASAPRIVLATERYTLAEWRSVLFFVWHATTRGEDVAAVRPPFDRWVDRVGTAGVVFTVVERGVDVPTGDARQGLNDLRARGRGAVVAMASVVEAEGFEAAALRSVSTGVSIATGAAFPHRSFSSTADASAWIETQTARTSAPLRASELSAALATVRAQSKASGRG